MSLFKSLSEKVANKKKQSLSLKNIFLDMEGTTEFPFSLALSTFDQLESQAQDRQELMALLLEDIIFSSLYATFYEEILDTIYKNPEVAVPLINRFSEDQEQRDQIIAEQTQSHLNFVLKKGFCPGCAHCDNHQDVSDLVNYWSKQDFKFFATLYMGMQTIQYSMEHILYDVIPLSQEYSQITSREHVQSLRQFIYDYVEEKLSL